MLRVNKLTRSLATISNRTPAPILLEQHTLKVQETLPTFSISEARGFLPRQDPLETLPRVFDPIDSLLNRMTIKQENGSRGLLAKGEFGLAVDHELKGCEMLRFVTEAIESGNQNLISALFRDYCFLTSAYLLEPVDQAFRATGSYAAGRNVLPESLAVPLTKLADAAGHFPFMEYASSYALQNYKRVQKTGLPQHLGDPSEWETDNLRVIRAFEDKEGSEAGFILVHISMVAYSGRIVVGAEKVLKAAQEGDVKAFNAGMQQLVQVYRLINQTMETMWQYSRPVDYLKFRSFIFGTGPEKMNSMFPNGVIYEGVSNEPQYFRGESGANDSIIPAADNILEITASLPANELTATLREFRAYRPNSQRVYLEGLEARATEIGIKNFAKGDEESLGLYILMVDQVREFRDRHWRFTKEYIIKRSDYSIATGGSPILKYLPSNLSTTLKVLQDSCDLLPSTSRLPPELAKDVEACRERGIVQLRVLEREVLKLTGNASKGIDDKRVRVGGSVGCDGVG